MDDRTRDGMKARLAAASARAAAWREPRGPHDPAHASEPCPVPSTHDKLREAHFFLHGVLAEVHHPDEFRWALNAFLQSCRSILYLAKSELRTREDFARWWASANAALDAEPLVRRVMDSRNFIVHERMLTQTSETQTGVFRRREFKVGIGGEVPNDWYSENLLRFVAHVWTGVFIDPDHSSVGEQFGIKREWSVAELGKGDVTPHCVRAHAALVGFVRSAHEFAGTTMEPDLPEPRGAHDPAVYSVLLETDLDPTLAEKWWGAR